ncbi:Selenoprotein K [Cricetulus griseus]|uniref:Selenoprotein K n=1 Tax=Cricetulus griseus TaxID=10029 RepID=G3I2B1_CRIGR|nr:Selenoprotein K [Cricetulus griseus]
MVYISNGQVLDSRNQSLWRLSFITDFFWGIAEFVLFFFFQNSASARCEKKEEATEAHLIPDTMMEEGHQETIHEEWVESVIFKAPTLLQWLVDEEGKCLL